MNQQERTGTRSAPVNGAAHVVLVCADLTEADQVSRQLASHSHACLVAYRKVEDFAQAAPRGNVALIILADAGPPEAVGWILRIASWRWRKGPTAVIGNAGDTELELVARASGASYFARPMSEREWEALVGHGLARLSKRDQRKVIRRPV